MVETPNAAPGGRPPAFVVSCLFGGVGTALLVPGVLADSSGLTIAGAAAGTLSLVAALVWRSQLIDAWHANRNRG